MVAWFFAQLLWKALALASFFSFDGMIMYDCGEPQKLQESKNL